MKTPRLIAASFLFSLALIGGKPNPSALTGACESGGTFPDCSAGEVTILGNNYPGRVHVVVTYSDGTVLDDSTYSTSNGDLSFTEDMSSPDSYTVVVSWKPGGGGSVTEVVVTM